MATTGDFYSNTANHWRAYGYYSYTESATETTINLDGYMQSVNWGFAIGGYDNVSVDARIGDYKADTTYVVLNTGYGQTGLSSPVCRLANKSIKKTHAAQSILLRVYVWNGSGYMGGNNTAETHITVPALASYAVKYDANGGTGAPSAQTKWYGETLKLSSTKPTKANASSTFTLTFDKNGGSATGASGDKLTATKTTTYAFSKWNTKSDGSGTGYNAEANYTANAAATLYAQYTSTSSTTSVKLPTPTRDGYNCTGWYTAASGGTKVGNPGANYTPTANQKLYAQWSLKTYAVAYDANGGTGAPSAQTKTHGTNLTLSTNRPTRSGYRFDGWATSKTGGVAYQPGGTYSANVAATLYAVWTAAYTLGFNANGGTGAPAAVTKYHGEAVTLPSGRPTKNGYTFAGWGTTANASAAAYQPGGTYPAGNNASATLYAVWAIGYVRPTVTSSAAARVSDEGGAVEDPAGGYIKASFTWAVDTSAMAGNVAASATVQSRRRGASQWVTVLAEQPNTATGTTVAVFQASEDHAFDIRITVADSSGQSANSTTKTVSVGTGNVPLELGAQGRSVGILAKAGTEGTITLGGTVYVLDRIMGYGGGGAYNIAHVYGGNEYGHGVAYGGGGAVIVGAGESWSELEGVADATAEELHLGSDQGIHFHAGCDKFSARKDASIDANGTYIAPVRDVSWVVGAKGQGAVYQRKSAVTQWSPALVMQTNGGGAWQVGNYNDERLRFVYVNPENVANSTNRLSADVSIDASGQIDGPVFTSGTYTDFITINETNVDTSKNIAAQIAKWGKLVTLSIQFYLKADISVPADGNISNKTVGNLIAGYRPKIRCSGCSGGAGPVVTYGIYTGGNIDIAAIEGTGVARTVAAGTQLEVCATFICA